MRTTSRFIISLSLSSCLLLSACESSHAPAPVDNGWNHVNSTQRVYVVQAGDTIYSIAWKFGKNYRKLAQYNKLAVPYTVVPGQSLKLTGSAREKTEREIKAPVNAPVNTVAIKTVTPVPSAAVLAPVVPATKGRFPWPLKGQIIADFGQQGNKGIDIAVPIGTPVKAIDGGSVVYAGDNLHGYGQLLIIKHEHDLMTAYAHNSKLLVKEGGTVTAGQVIALSGDSDAAKPMLHFEVRQAGHPVNPLNFLN